MKTPINFDLSKYVSNAWIRLSIQMLILALILTPVISWFFYVTGNSEQFNFRNLSITFNFCFWISMSIGFMAHTSQTIFKNFLSKPWMSLFLYYALMTIGMFVGTEITYFTLYLFYDIPFDFSAQLSTLRFNLFISLFIGTVMYVNDYKKEYFNLKLKDKQLDLLRLQELKTTAELQSLQSRINPHFLYNALNGIATLIHDEPSKAESMLMKLSALFRYSINNNKETLVSIKQELEVLRQYIELEEMRFGDKFSYVINIDDSMNSILIPRMILQPLVENCFKHAFSKLPGEKKLIINITSELKNVHIEISDNGNAFPEPLINGYGMQSVHDAFSLLYKDNFKFDFLNHPHKMVVLQFPIQN